MFYFLFFYHLFVRDALLDIESKKKQIIEQVNFKSIRMRFIPFINNNNLITNFVITKCICTYIHTVFVQH